MKMNESNRVRSASWTLSARGLRSIPLCLLLSSPALAQTPRVVVSTTDDVPAGVGLPFAITDTDLVAAGGGAGVRHDGGASTRPAPTMPPGPLPRSQAWRYSRR